ncbi:C40 family peptidase [Alicyclobacillus dauci]|uniref:C40 family peptidase n=1 Tax=Alicyclobacillus dauci TaxID=1475485 RepID=A0ABY6Z1J9_9BACL|nr:C40 family peptidase [Alicyclobacillus dauci]WAH36762.1 C40 family peptidase [Alicyclobacillus dauci]
MKRFLGILAGMSMLATIPTTALAGTQSAKPTSSKTIALNSQPFSKPQAIVSTGTTYMPIWYLMQALNELGISTKWDGHSLNISTPSGVNVNTDNVNPGTGSMSMLVNGTLVQRVDDIVAVDPSSGGDTTYVPIWYLMRILDRVTVNSSWNGNVFNLQSNLNNVQKRQDVVRYAKTLIGTKYQWGGKSANGCDCSGLVQMAFDKVQMKLPRQAATQAKVGQVVSTSNLQTGDLVFFKTTGSGISHVGIYVGNGKFISATSSHGVRITELHDPYYWGPRLIRATNPYV